MAVEPGITHVPGRLRLKSSGGSAGGVDKNARLKGKKKGKSARKSKDGDEGERKSREATNEEKGGALDGEREGEPEGEAVVHRVKDIFVDDVNADDDTQYLSPGKVEVTKGKTAAEIRFEERKRKRLNERLQKDGVKTHKERVQELNRYLSGLSEHHDMPRIGPG